MALKLNFGEKKELITLASNSDQRKMKSKKGVITAEEEGFGGWKYYDNTRIYDSYAEDEFEETENNLSRQIYELQTKLEQVQLEKEQRMRVEPHQKEPIFTIEDKTIEKIQKIVTDVKRYKTVQQFVNESLDNITTMWLEPEKMEAISADMWKDLLEQRYPNPPRAHDRTMLLGSFVNNSKTGIASLSSLFAKTSAENALIFLFTDFKP